jgi:hypothetical protein
MKQLSTEKRVQLLACLVEGTSIRATARVTGVAFNTVLKFVADAGRACAIYQDETFHNLPCKRLQCDEIWSFLGCKAKNVTDKNAGQGWGDIWTWTPCLPPPSTYER